MEQKNIIISKAQKISDETGLPLDINNINNEIKKEINNAPKWSKIYKEQNPDNIPWNFEKIPDWFIEIIKSGWVTPCRALDVGCGLGNYSNYLAENNFDVTGVDFSKEAIEKDQEKFKKNNLKFKECDALNLKSVLDKQNSEMFEFVIDISLLHHIKPEDRKKYAESLFDVTKNGSKILISCFSEGDIIFEGQKEFINPDTDTVTYVLSKNDIIEMFKDKFEIEDIQEIEFGKPSKIGGENGEIGSLTRKRHLAKLIRK